MTASADLEYVADQISRFPAEAVRFAVDDIGGAIERRMVTDTGGNRRLSGLDRRTRKAKPLKVRRSVTGTTFVEGKVSASPKELRGAWAWLDKGTTGGYHTRRRGAPGRHPGTPAKRTFSAPLEQRLPLVEASLAARWQSVLR